MCAAQMMQCASSFNPTMATVAQQITDHSLSKHLLPSIGICLSIFLGYVVRVEGLEPPRLAAPEPKSGASTNFATPALSRRRRVEGD